MDKVNFSLSTKILASFIAAMLAVFAYFAYSVVINIKDGMLVSEKEKGALLLSSVAPDIGMSLYLGFEAQSAQKAKELLEYQDVLSIDVKTIDGRSIGHFESLSATSEDLKRAIKINKTIKDSISGKQIATLEMSYSNKNYQRLIDNFKELIFKFGAIAALIFAFTLMFVKWLLSPLSTIASKMREYVPGKNITFDRNESDDEIGSIITSFEAMQVNINSFLEEIRTKDGELMRQSKLKALMDMISAVAHHWRQPLNAIGIILQEFRYAYKFNELNEAFIEKNIDIGMGILNGMSKTIDDFRLFFASNEKEESVDIGKASSDAIESLANQPLSKEITIEIHGDNFFVTGQKELLTDVIAQVVSNAKDALNEKIADNKDFKALIAISLNPDKKSFECRDNGGGMSAEALGRVFEPYFTTKEQGKGVGLGLFMARTVIANMNGELSVSNTDDGFSVLIEFER